MARQIVVEVVGDASGLAKATQEATGHMGKFHAAVTGMAMGVGIQAMGAVSGAIDGLMSKVGESGALFRADQVSVEKMTQALKNSVPGWDGNTAGIEKFASAQARLGFQDDDVRNSLALLAGVTHNVAKAQEDVTLAQELARAKGIDLASATNVIVKAEQDNYKSLKSLGIEVDKHATKQQAMAAIYANVKGQAEAYANTSAGKLEAANVKNSESWEKIGKIVNSLESVILPKLADAFEVIAGAVGPLADKFAAFLQSKEVQDFWAQVQPIFAQLIAVLQEYLPPVLHVIGEIIKVLFPVVAVIIKTAISVIILWIKIWAAEIGFIIAVIRGIATVVTQVVSAVGAGWNSMVAQVTSIPNRISSAATHMWDGIKNAFRAMLNAIVGYWNHLQFKLPKVDVGPIHTPSFDMKVPQIPYFHEGGTVPGAPGKDVLAMLQAGEHVTKVGGGGGSGGPSNVINISIGTYVGDASTLSKMLAKELRLTGVVLNK